MEQDGLASRLTFPSWNLMNLHDLVLIYDMDKLSMIWYKFVLVFLRENNDNKNSSCIWYVFIATIIKFEKAHFFGIIGINRYYLQVLIYEVKLENI